MGKHSFTRGAAILASASIISRLLGVWYIIALPRIIRDEGMGLLQMVRPFYNLAVILSIAGLPVALSKLVAEQAALGNTRGAVQVFKFTLAMLVLSGTVFTLLLGVGSKWFVENIVRDPLAYPPLLAVVPSVCLLAVVSAFRGFFQGMQYMTPTAVSQVVEQMSRVAAMIILGAMLMPRGVEYGAAGAAFGSTVGAAAALIVMVFYYFRWRKKRPLTSGNIRRDARMPMAFVLRRLVAVSLPIVLGSILWPMMQMIDTSLVPLRMQAAGFSRDAVREAVGYFGMALSLMHFPNVFTHALSVTLVPAVAEASALHSYHQVQHRVNEAVRITVMLGLPASTGLLVLADKAAFLLFGYAEAGEPLKILALGTLPLGLFQVCSGILQGLGLVVVPVRNLVVGAAVKFAVNYWLTGLPEVGIKGAAWGTVLSFAAAGLLNTAAVYRRVRVRPNWREALLKPGLVCLIMALGVAAAYDGLYSLFTLLAARDDWPWAQINPTVFANGLAVIGAVCAGAGIYGLGLVGTGALHRRDVEMIPKIGGKLSRWLSRYGWVR
ncbi:MAG TPA: polysaccharide biosynthesis protein [Firmicutes bacterium]|nr:polysaccharide biosynthesis protein [Bacillota bacterium]